MENKNLTVIIYDHVDSLKYRTTYVPTKNAYKQVVVNTPDELENLLENKLKPNDKVCFFIHAMTDKNYDWVEGENDIDDKNPNKPAGLIKKRFKNLHINYITTGSAWKAIEKYRQRFVFKYYEIEDHIRKNDIIPQAVCQFYPHKISYKQTTKSDNHVDYAIITALHDHEFENVKRVFNLKIEDKLKLGDKNIYSGFLDAKPYRKVIAVYQSEVGKTDSAHLTTEIIKEFNPKYVFMTGVCGGDESTSFGDVIIAKYVFTFDKGKISDKGFLRELEFVKMNEGDIRKIREKNKEILIAVKQHVLSDDLAKEKFKGFQFLKMKSFIDPMACSQSVIDKANYFNKVIKLVDRKAIAVEMESYGIARAAESTNSGNTKSLIIKSIMDNTVNKNNKAKDYASYTSALYLKCLLEKNIIE